MLLTPNLAEVGCRNAFRYKFLVSKATSLATVAQQFQNRLNIPANWAVRSWSRKPVLDFN